MLWLIASLLLLVWLVTAAFDVTAGLVHVVLVAALAVYLVALLRGHRGRTVP